MSALKRILTQNIGLKLLALVLAAVVWFLVTNLNDPSATVRFSNIPVNIRNTNLITSQGKVYEVLDGTDVISSVSVTAPRSIVDTFTKDNIIATADMSNLSSLDTLSIVLTTNKYSNRIESITGSIDTVRLSIEDRKTKTLAITASTAGTLPEGYIIGTVSTEQNVLRIEGPESAIDSVVTASVNVDVTGFTTDIDTDAEIDLYDKDGNEVNDSGIRKNINDV
ncbi:MAG: YbbR-like domain-containing protein, partial [Lachnospiraceae bacterium]|nr:YbbR-like domain-containing protein [Lachnospiraceae bacterium]